MNVYQLHRWRVAGFLRSFILRTCTAMETFKCERTRAKSHVRDDGLPEVRPGGDDARFSISCFHAAVADADSIAFK